MSDNPFEEDSDRTIIRPAPGGVRVPRPAAPETPGRPGPWRDAAPAAKVGRPRVSVALTDAEPVVIGTNPLVAAAAPLLSLIGRLSQTYSQPNPGELRERTLQQIRSFEDNARNGGVPQDQVIKARYVLCASLDDVAQNTEWGRDGVWASRPLVAGFREGLRGYEGIQSGVGFFRLLDQVRQRPGAEMPLLELMYLCLSLGFLGELRVDARPGAALERVRQEVYGVITNNRRAGEQALSPHWRGEAAPYRAPGAVLPSWVVGAAALAVIGALFVWVSAGLNGASDAAFERMVSAPLDHMPQLVRVQPVRPPPPPAPQMVAAEPLAVFLKPEIDQGLVTVSGSHAAPLIRIRNSGMFPSGSATVSTRYVRLLDRIGQALKAERGTVRVFGYTDNQPIRTVRFPSNFQLSQARAEAAGAVISRVLGQPGRVSAEGRANADPISSNDTPAGREENRRIEIVLQRQQ